MTKHNLKIKLLICCLLVVLAAVALAACNEYKPAHYDYLVTFDYNLGTKISGNASKMYLGVLDPDNTGSYVSIRPGFDDSEFAESVVIGYYIEGWYRAALDASGQPIVGADGRVQCGEKFDFAEKIHEDTTLYANLIKSPRILFVDAETNEQVGEMDGGRPGASRQKPSAALAPKKNVNGQAYTFMGDYYADRACTVPFAFPYVFGYDDVNVYCKFIKGNWTLVSNENDFLLAIANGNNIYLLEDLDFTGQVFGTNNFNGELNGNGHTVRGITISRTNADRNAINSRTRENIGIFATLMSRAYIHDINFEDVTITIEAAQATGILDVNIGVLAGLANAGARVENVKLSGILETNGYATYAYAKNGIAIDPLIAQSNTSADNIVNCDYSGVKIKLAPEENSEEEE